MNCTRCGQNKRPIAFALCRSNPSGFQRWCRPCHAAYKADYVLRCPQPPSRRRVHHKPTGRNLDPRKRRLVLDSRAGDVIRDLLTHTVWPQQLIADLAHCHLKTVKRILKASTIPTPRPIWRMKHVRMVPKFSLTRRLWRRFLAPSEPLTPLSIAQAVFTCCKDPKKAEKRLTRERHRRLNTRRSTRNMRDHTKKDERLLQMAQLMLVHNLMYGTPLPTPWNTRTPDLSWMPKAWQPTAYAALGLEPPA